MVDNFDPKKVSLIIGGQFITGFMDGTFIKTSKNSDNIVPHIGAQGDVTFSESADNTGTITVTLKQTSASLPYLISLSKQKTSFATQIVDANDNFRAGGNQCRITKTPDREFGAEVAGVEVQIYVADYDAK